MDADLKSEPGIARSTDHYDLWLLALEPAFAHDLKQKLKVMAGKPGDFLRATFYRWSERFPDVCLEAISAPVVRAVGDVHVGNFGTWPCDEGRLRWGLNDFDEAGWMPFTNDLVRLATSALLARNDLDPEVVGHTILSGYSQRIRGGEFGALDIADDAELRISVAAAQTGAEAFFGKLAGKDELDADDARRLARLRERLNEAVPGGEFHHRRAGRGSLGRVRVFVLGKGDPPVAIEAKRVLRSAWSWARRGGHADPNAADDRNDDLSALLLDARRGPDLQTRVEEIDDHQWVLRPLSPDRVGIDFGDTGNVSKDLATRLLDRMGAEVAHIHLLSHDPAPIMSYLADHEPGWLSRAAVAMKEDTESDSEAWKKHRGAADKDAAGDHG
jgi:Uncharacterized protein conserved in bacteria (DUF2252)